MPDEKQQPTETVQAVSDIKAAENSELRDLNVDWFLASLVNEANSFGIERGVTLSVSGALVTGTLIGVSAYFRELAEQIRSLDDLDELQKSNAETYEFWSSRSEVPGEVDAYAERPLYIHLRGVRTFLGHGLPLPQPSQSLLWRGKISSVDGFFFGELIATSS